MNDTRQRFLGVLAAWLSIFSIGAVILGFGPRDWWLCDMLANLRTHVVLALLVLSAAQLALGVRRLAGAAVAVALVAITLSFDFSSRTAVAGEPAAERLRILSYNLSTDLNSPSLVGDYLAEVPADIVVLQEYTFAWHERLAVLSEHFPYSTIEPRPGPFGIALYSRLPLDETKASDFPDSGIPFITSTLDVGERRLSLVGLHMNWPIFPSSFAARNGQIEYVIDMAAAAGSGFVACGDWNTTPWSRWYQALQASGLHDGNSTHRLLPTWPTWLGWLGIPIDHCFASADLDIESKQIGPRLGSDHRPILVTLAL